jgi:hypothetical protein
MDLNGMFPKLRRSAIAAAAMAVLGMHGASTSATTVFGGSVTGTGTYGDGSIYIFLTNSISEPGCTVGNRIDVRADHPQLKQILAIAMSAKVSGTPVWGAVHGCDPATGNPTFDVSKASYFYLTN